MNNNNRSNIGGSIVWPLALVLIFVGLILLPIHLRRPFLRLIEQLKPYSLTNFACVLAALILLITKRDYTKAEFALCGLWLLLLIPLSLSCREQPLYKPVTAALNCWFPAFLIIQRINAENREKTIRIVLRVFDLFVAVLFCIGLYEKMNGHILFRTMEEWLRVNGLKSNEYTLFVSMLDSGIKRFFSFWGHPLTNAVLFNACFILNDIYHRSINKRYPKILFFVIAIIGDAVLSVGKTAVVVCALYFVLINWKQKRWFIVYILGAAAAYFSGLLNNLIDRFTNTSITSGRVDRLIEYFSGDLYPLRFFTGYGYGTTYLKEMKHLSPAFEFPVLMFALDYGILFSILFVGSIFLYYSYHFLKRKQYMSWIGISLLFAQLHTYNGMSLRNQDIGWFTAMILMIAINSVALTDNRDNSEPSVQ